MYAGFWDRVLNKRDETVFSSVKEGLDLLLKEQAVIHISDGMLKGYFKSNPFHIQNIKTFAKGRASFYSVIVPINSPLKPILQKATNQLQQSGTMRKLMGVWMGKFNYSFLRFNEIVSTFLFQVTKFLQLEQ